MAERLDPAYIASLLHGKWTVLAEDTVDSTNSWARRRLAEGHEESAVLLAEYQSAGRGRQGKSFYSPRGTGLYMTLVIPWGKPIGSPVEITVGASIAVCRALEEMTGREYGIKWVNDIYDRDKKVCGILAEAVNDWEQGVVRSLILGIGVNVRPASVPEELRDIVGWLEHPVDRNQLCARIVNRLEAGNTDLDYYKSRSVVLGRRIRFLENGVWQNGHALDVDKAGGLVVRRENGQTDTLTSGEISVRPREDAWGETEKKQGPY